jgi:acyl dehydratase
MTRIRQKAALGLEPGDRFTVSRTYTLEDVHDFAKITKDYNPIHFDNRFVQIKKFNGKICHGLLVASLITEIGGQIGWLAAGMSFRFNKPVYPQDTITCAFQIKSIDEKGRAEAEALFHNQKDELVLEAFLTGIVPGNPEREVLKSILTEEIGR